MAGACPKFPSRCVLRTHWVCPCCAHVTCSSWLRHCQEGLQWTVEPKPLSDLYKVESIYRRYISYKLSECQVLCPVNHLYRFCFISLYLPESLGSSTLCSKNYVFILAHYSILCSQKTESFINIIQYYILLYTRDTSI